MRILVTGATGFIGRETCRVLSGRGHRVRAAVRRALPALQQAGIEQRVVGEIDGRTDWRAAVDCVDAILHLAGRAHVLAHDAAAAADHFHSVNVEGAVALLQAAQAAGVRRFVNVSSIGVLGQSTELEPFSDASSPRPVNAYASSKLAAETALAAMAAGTEVVTIRPPMVYGPGCPGNMARLLRLVRTGVPLPLALARAERDMIGIDNLVDILATCADHPAVAGQTYVVCDGEPVSTAGLVRMLGASMGRVPWLFPVPFRLLALAAAAAGRADDVRRLFLPLRIDDGRFRRHTGWAPVTPLRNGLEQTVRRFNEA